MVDSWPLDLLAIALAEDPALANYQGYVDDSGEGRWTIMAEHTFAEKILSAMRRQFGGHQERPSARS